MVSRISATLSTIYWPIFGHATKNKMVKPCVFRVGTDEHGNKIAAKAGELGIEPQAYTDQMVGNFKDLMNKIGADYTDFIRTTDLAPRSSRAQYIWQTLNIYIQK